MKWRQANDVGGINGCAGIQEKPSNIRIAGLRRQMQGGPTFFEGRIDDGALPKQKGDHARLAFLDCHVQRRDGSFTSINFCPMLDEQGGARCIESPDYESGRGLAVPDR